MAENTWKPQLDLGMVGGDIPQELRPSQRQLFCMGHVGTWKPRVSDPLKRYLCAVLELKGTVEMLGMVRAWFSPTTVVARQKEWAIWSMWFSFGGILAESIIWYKILLALVIQNWSGYILVAITAIPYFVSNPFRLTLPGPPWVEQGIHNLYDTYTFFTRHVNHIILHTQ